MASSRAGPVRRAMTGVVRCGSLAVLVAVLVSALLPSAATGSNETSHFPPEDTTPLRGGYIPPGGRTCTRQAAECVDGMLLPAWLPVNDISSIDRALRAIVYLLAMVYLFLGVSIIADRFMAAIEVITSTEREMTVCRPNGEVVVVNVRVWNETVSNLTLMALGSSAPEILLSIIEVIGNDFKAGDLGPGTIVGSAAFNLFVIIGLCVAVIPCTESRRIKHLRVFFITATWSVFAYLWLYVIISVSSPNVVEVWEAVLTFLFFPATVLTAYVADRKIFFYNFLSRRYRATVAGTAVRVDGREALELGEKEAMGDGAAEGKDAGLKEFEKTRQEYIDMLRELRKKHPDVDMHTLESMAASEMLNRGPKSRAFYRIQATRKLTGGGNIIKRKAAERRESLDDVAFGTTADDDVVRLFFEPGHYTVMENVGSVLLTVVRQGGDLTSTTTYVDFRTEDGTANAGSDYVFTEGTLIFQPGETQRHIEVQVIDDDVFEEDEHFFVNLSNARNGAENETSAASRIQLVNPCMATVMILDDDHAGIYHFDQEDTSFPESIGESSIRVARSSGARGRVALPYKTVEVTAKGGGVDFVDVDDELIFENDEIEGFIKVRIINHEEYEKNQTFRIELGEPRVIDADGKSADTHDSAANKPIEEMTDEERIAQLGKPKLGEMTVINCHIRESIEFKSTVDKLLRKANTSIVIGTSSWREQFVEAVTVSSGDDDDEEGGDEEKAEGGAAKSVPSMCDYIMHWLSLFWKLLFAFVPPTDYLGGWAAFTVSIMIIGLLTAVIGDVASHFGCTVGLKDSVTALSFVALGTSIPDTFASKVAAIHDEYADSSIGNVTGSNAVNVFLGIGIAWTIAAVYHAFNGGQPFVVKAGTLGFSVTIFCACALVSIAVLLLRRMKSIGGELGGPARFKYPTVILMFGLWIFYVLMSAMESYCYIEGF